MRYMEIFPKTYSQIIYWTPLFLHLKMMILLELILIYLIKFLVNREYIIAMIKYFVIMTMASITVR